MEFIIEFKRTAKELEAEVRSRLKVAEASGIWPYKVHLFFDDWLALKEKQISPNTHKRYSVVLEKALQVMPEEMYQVKPHHIEKHRDSLIKQGYKPRSIILELNVLKDVFRKAVRMSYIGSNPVEGIEKPKRPPPQVEPYTDEEVSAIFTELNRRSSEGRHQGCAAAWAAYREVVYLLLPLRF